SSVSTPAKETSSALRQRQCLSQPSSQLPPRFRTRAAIRSVTPASVQPPASTGVAAETSGASPGVLSRRSGGLGEGSVIVLLQFAGGIDNAGQITGARTGVQFVQGGVAAPRSPAAADPAVRIVEIAEYDGLGRADRLAGGDHIPVGNGAAGLLGFDAGMRDTLHTIRAFLHHAALAHGNVGILMGLRAQAVVGILEEVEAPHLVGTVIRTKARPHAAVVDL